jgi:hypothetical protein
MLQCEVKLGKINGIQTSEADLEEFLYAWTVLGSVSVALDGANEYFACPTT